MTIRLEKHADVAVIRLDNGVTNAINRGLLNDLQATLDEVRAVSSGLVLAGGDKFFSIGFDLPTLIPMEREQFSLFWDDFNQLFYDIYTLPIPTLCAMRGHAVAGGAILALATDFRIGTAGKKRIGLNELKLGIPVPLLADLVLRQLVGDRVATNMIFGAEFALMEEVARPGLIDQVHAIEQVESRALDRIRDLARHTGPAFASIKQNRTCPITARYEKSKIQKREEFLDMWFSEPVRNLLQAAAKMF